MIFHTQHCKQFQGIQGIILAVSSKFALLLENIFVNLVTELRDNSGETPANNRGDAASNQEPDWSNALAATLG
jgi:hypothetical protein